MGEGAKYQRIIRAVYERPWAIHPPTLELILDILEFRAQGGRLEPDEIQARIEGASNGPRNGGRQAGTVAVIPVYGPISMRQNLMSASSGGTSIEGIAQDFRTALADPGVGAIVLEVDSPGGTVDGIPELADEIMAARGQKPILAHANVMAASAAYWLATAADQLYVTKSGMVGSVGVFTAHQDESAKAEAEGVKTSLISYGKYKTEGNRFEPLSDDARENLQAQVDAIGQMFESSLARQRATPVETVRKSYGEGRIILAKQALERGMVDGIATLDDTIRRASRLAMANTKDAATAALDTELPFTARLALVTAGANELASHAQARLEMRATKGRQMTEADRIGLMDVADTLRRLAETDPAPDPEPEPEPAPEPSTAWVQRARVKLELARAEHNL